MAKTLIIAEKPSVGQDYAKALGDRFAKHDGYLESDERIISWAIGHLVELAEPEDYDESLKRWSIKTLPVLPESFKLKPDARGKKQYDVLRKLLKRADVDAVVNGCDAGREGELIFAYIYEKAGAAKPVQRLWVNSMTKTAIRDGFQDLRSGEEMRPLEAAARSRSEADWLVGMNATRAATVRGRALGGVVSLGRVQTPTLALIVRRDLEIDAFEPETYFQVDARFELDQQRTYKGRWFEGKLDRTPQREVAESVATAARGQAATVEQVKKTERRTRPPLLYDLTALQRDANSRWGISASRTLQAAQRLYEGSSAGALITYPRTRSQFLPSDQVGSLKGIAHALAALPAHRQAAEYVAGLDVLPLARVVNDGKVDDHHAIIPTGERPTRELSGDDARIFELVVRRYLAVFHPEAVFEDTDVITEAGGQRFRTKGRRLIQPGWRAAAFGDEAAREPGSDDEDDGDQVLPRIDQGDSGVCTEAEVLEKQTKPPPRYSEASLLKDMETAGREIEDEELREAMKDSGLGTPATRAETIEKLIRVAYVERLGRQLRATSKGRQVIGLLHDHALTSAELTGSWEKRLTGIERGQDQRDGFMHDIRQFTSELVEYFRNLTPEEVRAQRAEIGPCANGDGVIRENRAAYGCSSWQSKEEPGCGFVIWKQQKGRSISPAEARDLLEHGQTELLDGFKTRPSRARLVLVDGKVQLLAEDGTRLDAPAGPREVIAECPRCAAQGVKNEIRENSRAYGCSSWKSRKEPGCGFVIWKSTKGRQITPEEAKQVIEHGHTDWLDFRDRKGPFRGRLVLTPDQAVEVEREDSGGERASEAA
ncbi:MAG: DNA topoisomerase 3 [Gaiellales bacterium]